MTSIGPTAAGGAKTAVPGEPTPQPATGTKADAGEAPEPQTTEPEEPVSNANLRLKDGTVIALPEGYNPRKPNSKESRDAIAAAQAAHARGEAKIVHPKPEPHPTATTATETQPKQ